MRKKTFKEIIYLIFIIYLVALIYFLFFSEKLGRGNLSNNIGINLKPFNEIKRYMNNKSQIGDITSILNIYGNVFLFIPYGIMMPLMQKKRKIIKTTFYTMIFSIIIEFLQYIFKVGIFDIDDIILNTIGGFLGYIIYKIFRLCYNK